MLISGCKTMVTRPLLSWRHLLRTQQNINKFSSSVAPTPATAKQDEPEVSNNSSKSKRSNSMVAAAFQSLTEPEVKGIKFPSLDDRITASDSIDALLSVADSSHVTKKHALKIVSVIADWASENKVKITDFESDARFHKLCRMLGRNYKNKNKDINIEPSNSEDLATVLEVTGDDEAAKLIGTISFQQMIKVLSTLAIKKRRSTPLLRAIAFNLCRDPQHLNVKQSADLLFAMSTLNFPDENLMDKVRNDIAEGLPTNQKAAPVGSILTSLGLLRHKDPALLDSVSDWVGINSNMCRPQDIVSFLLTLAHVGYKSDNSESTIDIVMKRLTGPQDVPTLSSWLDAVWALALLGRLTSDLATSVLEPKFRETLMNTTPAGTLPVPARLKLLNINAVAQNELNKYSGPLLDLDNFDTSVVRSRGKEQLVQCVLDTLSNLLPSQNYLKTAIDTKMGFLIDGECLLDTKGNPLQLSESQETPAKKTKKGTRIAILVWDYSDLCRGKFDPTGPNLLAEQLLTKQGLRVCSVPYTEFNPKEKLVQRVQYLEKKIKDLAKER